MLQTSEFFTYSWRFGRAGGFGCDEYCLLHFWNPYGPLRFDRDNARSRGREALGGELLLRRRGHLRARVRFPDEELGHKSGSRPLPARQGRCEGYAMLERGAE